MNRFIRSSYFKALAVCSIYLMLIMRCTQPVSTADGGFGSETTNGKITGTALLPGSSHVAGARVTVRRADFFSILDTLNSFAKRMTTNNGDVFTNKSGFFEIDSLDTGLYVLEINDERAHAVCQTFRISHDQSNINSGADTLKMYATVKGEISVKSANDKRFVQVCGLERLVPVDENGSYIINDLPPGTFTLKIVSIDTTTHPIIIDSVKAKSGAVTEAPAEGWIHSQNIILNTSATGANITSDVNHFPVLIRLTKNNFSFDEAERNGNDLRFVKSDGVTLLPFEIERWDSAGALAEIWVTIDTIHGLNDTQHIVMRWGNPSAKALSNGAAAFDTVNGFRAVWHLNQKCDDVTYNKNNGTNSGASDTSGMIGFCKEFHGTDSIKISGLLGSPQSLTLSAWAQLDSTLPYGGSEVISIGDAALIRMDYSILNNGTLGAIHPHSYPKDSGFCNVSSGKYLKQTGWHLITYTVDQNNHSLTLFIDGAIAHTMIDTNSITIDYSVLGQNTFIGKHGNGKTGYGFFGRIDEVRVYSKSVAADYVKLCYMNQKNQDALIVFK